LVAKLNALESRLRAIEEETANLHPVPRLAPAVIESRLAEYRRLLRASTTQARTVLQRVLRGRITFTPREDGRGYDFTAATRWDRVFAGIATPRPKWIPVGSSGVEHPHEKDYGELLEKRALRVASPREPALVTSQFSEGFGDLTVERLKNRSDNQRSEA